MIRRFGTTALPAMLLSACYSYQTVTIAEVPVGAPVRARLAPDEAARVGEVIGSESRVFEGELLSRSDSGMLVLRIPTIAREHSAAVGVNYQNVSVGAQSVQEVEIRKLDRGRTTGALTIGAAVIVSAVIAALVLQQQPAAGTGKGGSDALRPAPWP